MQIPRLVGSGPQGLNHLQQCSLSGAIDSLVARQLAAPALLSFADARSSVSDFFSSLGEGFADRASHNVAYYARMYLRLLAVKFVPFAARFNGLAVRAASKADLCADLCDAIFRGSVDVLALREPRRRGARLSNVVRRALLLEALQQRFVAAGKGRERSNLANARVVATRIGGSWPWTRVAVLVQSLLLPWSIRVLCACSANLLVSCGAVAAPAKNRLSRSSARVCSLLCACVDGAFLCAVGSRVSTNGGARHVVRLRRMCGVAIFVFCRKMYAVCTRTPSLFWTLRRATTFVATASTPAASTSF